MLALCAHTGPGSPKTGYAIRPRLLARLLGQACNWGSFVLGGGGGRGAGKPQGAPMPPCLLCLCRHERSEIQELNSSGGIFFFFNPGKCAKYVRNTNVVCKHVMKHLSKEEQINLLISLSVKQC